MNKAKSLITKLPAWIMTISTLLMIGWLTLAPKPLGDTSVSLFPDADKLVHAVMFGMLTIGILADRQRQTGWKEIPVWMATLAVAVASGTGAGIEFLQEIMGLGRTFETADMIADAGGSMIAAQLFLMMQPRWPE